MNNLWAALTPLIIGSAVVPVELIMTILFLRSAAGRITSVAFIAGMTAVRLAQGVIFGLIVSASSDAANAADDSPNVFTSTVLLVVGVLFLVTGVRSLLGEDDPDAPPPKWLKMTETMTPVKAFGLGAVLMLIGVKFWVFTLGAISAIGDADLGQPTAAITFIVFALLAVVLHLVILGYAYAAPESSTATLDRASSWLSDHNRVIMTVLGFVFGVWFLYKALDGLGVI